MIAGLAIALTTPAFAADWRKGAAGGGGRGGGVVAHAAPAPQFSRPTAPVMHMAAPVRQFSGANPGFSANSFHAVQPSVVSRSPAFSRPAPTRTFTAPTRGVFTPSIATTAPGSSHRFTQSRLNNTGVSPRFTNAVTPQNGVRTFGNNRFARNRGNNGGVSPQFANAGGVRNATAFNRSNHYGGRWFAASAHPDWNRGSEYFWNHHHYRWYDGGWLIVDSGFWPYGYPYDYGYDYPYHGYDDYNNQPAPVGDSTAADVQSKLAQLGYYNGDVDGQIGPLSRQAIANYQADQGLPVSGAIDDQLLESLGLE